MLILGLFMYNLKDSKLAVPSQTREVPTTKCSMNQRYSDSSILT